MTWLGETTFDTKPQGDKRQKLLEKREALIKEIEALKVAPLKNASAATLRFRQEDLIALAGKVKALDKKLGRQIDTA